VPRRTAHRGTALRSLHVVGGCLPSSCSSPCGHLRCDPPAAAGPSQTSRPYERSTVSRRTLRQVAGLLGVTRPAVRGRIHRGTLPAVENGVRFWVGRDHPEQAEAARLLRKTRRP